MTRTQNKGLSLALLLAVAGCGDNASSTSHDDAGVTEADAASKDDAATHDAAAQDAATHDAAAHDAAAQDAAASDAATHDAAPNDASTSGDTGTPDDASGGGRDAGPPAEPFFIAVGGGTKIIRSDDGSTWSVVSDTYPGAAGWPGYDTENLFRSACAGRLPSGQPLVLAVGGGTASSPEASAVSSVPGRIARSSDGKSWTHEVSLDGASPSVLLNTNWLGGCAFGNGKLVVTGAYYSLTSTDGASFAKHTISGLKAGASDVEFFARHMVFGAGLFVAAGEPGIYASTDGVAWEVVSEQKANRLFFHDGVFLAVFENETGYRRSTDGRSWSSLTAPLGLNRVAHDGTRFVASSADGALLTSSDGTSFTTQANKNDQSLSGIAFGKDTYVSIASMTTALYFRGQVTSPPLAWQSAPIPGDGEGFHDLSVLFADFD